MNDVFDAYGVALYLKNNNLPSLSISLEEKKNGLWYYNQKLGSWSTKKI